MNPELFTEEYRSFKFLKSTADEVKYYKDAEILLGNIRPPNKIDDGPFVWQKRIEFFEQLVDLAGTDVWYVDMNGTLKKTGMHEYDYDTAKLIEIKECVLYTGFPQKPGRYITASDIDSIVEGHKYILNNALHTSNKLRLYICSKAYYMNVGIEMELRENPFDPMICLGLFEIGRAHV